MPGANYTGSWSTLQSGDRIVVPGWKRLRLRLFEEFHSSRMGRHFVETSPRYDESVPPCGRAREIRHLSGASVRGVSARHASWGRRRRRCHAGGKPRLYKIVISSSDHHRFKTDRALTFQHIWIGEDVHIYSCADGCIWPDMEASVRRYVKGCDLRNVRIPFRRQKRSSPQKPSLNNF